MITGQQNMFNQPPLLTPGRVTTKVKRHTFPTGRIIELRWVTTTLRDDHGTWRTEETIEAKPPLDDGAVLTEENYHKLQECTFCRNITVESIRCPRCFQWSCYTCCANEIEYIDENIKVCAECARQIEHPFLSRLSKIIWDI